MYIFSSNWPTGAIRSSSRDVHVSVCLFVPFHVVDFEAYFCVFLVHPTVVSCLTIRIGREIRCLPYAGFFKWLVYMFEKVKGLKKMQDFTQKFFLELRNVYKLRKKYI